MPQTAPKREFPTRQAIVKLQSVRIVPVTVGVDPTQDGMSVGKMIDSLLREAMANDQMPNKLVIDLNPPSKEDDYDMN